MELSLLCDSKIFLCIVDKVEKLTIYSSENDINKFLGTYLQRINQNKIQKDILSNTDYNTLFTNTIKEEASKFPEDGMMYSYNDDEKTVQMNNVKHEYQDHHDEKVNFMNFNDQFDNYMNNEKDNDFNLYLNNQHHALFEEEQDLSSNNYRINTFKSKSEEDASLPEESNSPKAQNINQIFSTVFSTDNHSVSSNGTGNAKSAQNAGNAPLCPQKKPMIKNVLCNKRGREEINKLNNKTPNKMLEKLPNNLNHNINFAVINSQNLAHLLPNLNLLSQNIGVVNWVVPMNSTEEH